MVDTNLNTLVTIMTQGQTPRVWSLLVSLFGDLAKGKGDAISSQTLNQIMGEIGIKPEAVRVALHRLRKEGWLESERQGRSSIYALTAWGRSESLAASPRIYQKIPLPERAWVVIQKAGADELDGFLVAPNISITAEQPNISNVFCKAVEETDHLPDWMQDRLITPDFSKQTHEAAQKFRTLNDAVSGLTLKPLQTVVLRVLVVHTWRRIALRIPAFPAHLFPSNWRGGEAEALAHALLAQMPAPSLGDLS